MHNMGVFLISSWKDFIKQYKYKKDLTFIELWITYSYLFNITFTHMVADILGIDKSGFISLVQYAFLALPLAVGVFYVSTVVELKKVLNTTGLPNVPALIKKEFEEDNNLALAIFLAAKFIAITTIVSFSMILNLAGVILFALVGYGIQQITVTIVEKMLNLNLPLEQYIIEKQNVPVVVLYAGLVIGLSGLIGSLFL